MPAGPSREGNMTTVVAMLDSAGDYQVGADWTATVVILDDADSRPVATIPASDPVAAEEGPDAGAFTIDVGYTEADLTVDYTVAGTAAADADHAALPDSVTIPAGSGGATIVVDPVDDFAAEGDEAVVVTLVEVV